MNKKLGAGLVCAGLLIISTQALAWGDRERAGLLGVIGGSLLANSWYNPPPRVYAYPPVTVYAPPPRIYEYPARVVYPPPRIYEYPTVYAPPRYVDDVTYIDYGTDYGRGYRVYR